MNLDFQNFGEKKLGLLQRAQEAHRNEQMRANAELQKWLRERKKEAENHIWDVLGAVVILDPYIDKITASNFTIDNIEFKISTLSGNNGIIWILHLKGDNYNEIRSLADVSKYYREPINGKTD